MMNKHVCVCVCVCVCCVRACANKDANRRVLSSNGYSLYCAELMVNMKDVPSTERMVLCSKQWKMMTQKEKDMFQKRCEQVGSDTLTSQRESSLLKAALSS